ncbi:MAG: 4Fe-4S dicluster domain-containing protein [Pseudomonadota bacterium]|nr:4Fe-4S binding protein [Desulfobacterales bacterium]MBL7172857.1 4Fe-4S binding protein [Desulfobacteraceae bacterium]
MKPYALIIDHKACWGCKTCEVACKQENGASDGIRLIFVLEEGPQLIDGKIDFAFRVNVCTHCDVPPCLDACPEGAITKRPDGIVVMDDEKCSGCESCIEACSYHAIAFDAVKGVAQKCNLCHHRVDQGLIPACADNVCLAHCIYFGDPSEIP